MRIPTNYDIGWFFRNYGLTLVIGLVILWGITEVVRRVAEVEPISTSQVSLEGIKLGGEAVYDGKVFTVTDFSVYDYLMSPDTMYIRLEER